MSITIATAISRVTGFVRVMVVAAALGTTFLANTYQTANTAPNLIFELVAAGVLTSVFVPTFVDYLVKGDREAGWRAADALTSVALVGLIGLSIVIGLCAPLLMRALTLGVSDPVLRAQEIALGTTFLRLFAPQVVFYGSGMIMTAALQAHRRFGMPAVAPIFNNVVVILVYLLYAAMRGTREPTVEGITSAETLVLGVGTTLGVIAMTLALVPSLARLGWRFRFTFDPSHPAVRRGMRLGVWALGYAGGYQAGLIVVLLLANRVEGGVAAYQWAYTFFYLPHALVGVPIFSVLFTVMSEHATRGEMTGLSQRLQQGIAMLGFILIPVAAGLIALSEPLARVTLSYGVMTVDDTRLVARVVAAFAFGLPAYSAFLIFTRAFYALGDARSPAIVNAVSVAVASSIGAGLFAWFPEEWKVAGLAVGHSVGFTFGAVMLAWMLDPRVRGIASPETRRSLGRALAGSVVALAAMVSVTRVLPQGAGFEALGNLTIASLAGVGSYVVVARMLGSTELVRVGRLLARRR